MHQVVVGAARRGPPGHALHQDPRRGPRRRQEAVPAEGHRPRPSGLDPRAAVRRRWRRARPAAARLRPAHPEEDEGRRAARCAVRPGPRRPRARRRPASSRATPRRPRPRSTLLGAIVERRHVLVVARARPTRSTWLSAAQPARACTCSSPTSSTPTTCSSATTSSSPRRALERVPRRPGHAARAPRPSPTSSRRRAAEPPMSGARQ